MKSIELFMIDTIIGIDRLLSKYVPTKYITRLCNQQNLTDNELVDTPFID